MEKKEGFRDSEEVGPTMPSSGLEVGRGRRRSRGFQLGPVGDSLCCSVRRKEGTQRKEGVGGEGTVIS